MKLFKNAVFKIDDIGCKLANLCIFVNMSVVVISVFMRIFLESPIAGLTDIVGFAFALSVVLALPYTEKCKDHVRVEFIAAYFPGKVQKVISIFINLLNILCISVIAWQFFLYTMRTFEAGNSTWVIFLPYYPIVFIGALGLTLFALTAIVHFMDEIKGWKEETK